MKIIKHSWSDCSTKPGNIIYIVSLSHSQEIMPRVKWILNPLKKKFNETFFRLSDIIEQATEIWYGMRQLSNEIILNEFILRYLNKVESGKLWIFFSVLEQEVKYMTIFFVAQFKAGGIWKF